MVALPLQSESTLSLARLPTSPEAAHHAVGYGHATEPSATSEHRCALVVGAQLSVDLGVASLAVRWAGICRRGRRGGSSVEARGCGWWREERKAEKGEGDERGDIDTARGGEEGVGGGRREQTPTCRADFLCVLTPLQEAEAAGFVLRLPSFPEARCALLFIYFHPFFRPFPPNRNPSLPAVLGQSAVGGSKLPSHEKREAHGVTGSSHAQRESHAQLR
jgi:hypothetical protein